MERNDRVVDGDYIEVAGSKPGVTYKVYALNDPTKRYCTCPGWKFQHKRAEGRSCKHIDRLLAAGVVL